MLVEINDIWYSVPNNWSEVYLDDFIELSEYATENLPKEDATEAEKFQFYLDYISLFGIPKDELRQVKLYSEHEESLGIVNLFNHLWQFASMPTEDIFEDFDRFLIDGQMYMFNTNSVDLTGGQKPMVDYTFQEYEELNTIMLSMNKVAENKLDHLALLCAVFYRPIVKKKFQFFRKYEMTKYDESTVKARADIFKDKLSMDKIFKAYFFLFSRLTKSRLDTADYLIKEVEKNLA